MSLGLIVKFTKLRDPFIIVVAEMAGTLLEKAGASCVGLLQF
jgi:hypothetical protein